MSSDRRTTPDEVFAAALAVPAEGRAAFLDARCAGDPALRAEVESLLAYDRAADGFMESLPFAVEAAAVDADSGARGDWGAAAVPGERIGRYTVRALLGSGGMGVVYLAEQDRPRRTVALKVIKPSLVSPGVLRRFERESQVLALLQHPGIAQVFEAGAAETEDGPRPFFAMELVRGRPLVEYADAHRLGRAARLELFARICDAAHHAHQKGVVHRDLKPANILVDESGQPKILDFGVARAAGADVALATVQTDAGQLVGTLAYMSPEQVGATGDPRGIDARSDVYALGVVLFELLAGRPPYDVRGRTIAEAARMIEQDDPSSLGSVSPELCGDIDTIVGKSLEKDREHRYQSAADLAADLRRCLRDEPIVARPPSATYQLRKFATRNRGLVGGVVAAFVILLLGIGATGWQAVAATRQRNRAVEAELLASRRLAEVDRARRDEADQRRIAEEQRAAAQAEAQTALAINGFFEELLGSAHPNQALGEELTVHELLDRAAGEVEKELAGTPHVQAAIQSTIGTTYQGLGLYEEAEGYLRRSLETCRRIAGPEARTTLIAMNNLGMLLDLRDQHEEAEALHREAVQTRRRLLGNDHEDTLVSLSNLGGLLVEGRRYADAEPLLREVLEGRLRLLGEEHKLTATSMFKLARLLADQSKLPEAEALYRRAVEVQSRVLHEDHPDLGASKNSLAILVLNRGHPAEAEALWQEVIASQRRVLPPGHPNIEVTQMNLASAYAGQDEHAEAETLLREVLAARRARLGDEHDLTLLVVNNLVPVLKDQKKFAEAEPLARELVRVRRATRGDRHVATLFAINGLSSILLANGDFSEAEALYGEAVRTAKEVLPAGHWHTATFQVGYGGALLKLGRFEEAEAQLIEGHGTFVGTFGGEHERTRIAAGRLVELYESWGKPERAVAYRPAAPAEAAATSGTTPTPSR